MHFSFQNILAANGIGITITGMLIVLAGMLMITLFIGILPRTLTIFDRLTAGSPAPSPVVGPAPAGPMANDEVCAVIGLALEHLLTGSISMDSDTAAAIAVALHMEMNPVE